MTVTDAVFFLFLFHFLSFHHDYYYPSMIFCLTPTLEIFANTLCSMDSGKTWLGSAWRSGGWPVSRALQP
jgi:hypothetical protein